MLTKNTVFILGAGASADYSYPTGASLCDQIVNVRNDNDNIKKILIEMGFSEKEVFHFADSLYQSGRYSVDAFLEHRPELIEIGKASIAAALIPKESQSALMNRNGWYRHLYNCMSTSFDKFSKHNISFITFNYDRSLEQYLFTALKNTYGKNVNHQNPTSCLYKTYSDN